MGNRHVTDGSLDFGQGKDEMCIRDRNGSYIETGTYNGEVIYGCDESTIRNAAKKYSEQLGSDVYKRQGRYYSPR